MKKLTGILLASFLLIPSVQAEELVHVVAKGETLYALSRQYHLSLDQIKKANQLATDQIKIGQKLVMSTSVPEVTQVVMPTQAAAVPPVVQPEKENPLTVVSNDLQARVTADFLNLREAPDLKSKIIGTLLQGNVIVVLESGEFWSKVQVDKTIGYVSSLYMEPIQTVEKASRSAEMEDTRIQNVISPLIGIPYKFGGTSPDGFDCSGFTWYVMNRMGVKLPRTSEEQFTVGDPVEREDLQVGDLLFFDSYGTGKITHVSIYIGNNKIVHSASEAVVVDDATWFFNHYPYYGAKRVLEQ